MKKTQQRRLSAAVAAIRAYQATGAGDPDSLEDTLTDLLTDLMHWADHREEVNYEICISRATAHFAAEQSA